MYNGLVPIPLLPAAVPTQSFRIHRIISVTRPNVGVGLPLGFAYATRQQLEALTAEGMGFHMEDLVRGRGNECRTEQFMLQAGNSLDGPWQDIKPIVPVPGNDPRNSVDEEDDDSWGQCMRCKHNLTESEAALSDACEGCYPTVYAEWQANQERLAEQAAEARWIM